MVRRIEFPRVVLNGPDCLDESGNVARELCTKGKDALIVSSEMGMKIAGDKVKALLEEKEFNVHLYLAEAASENTISEAQSIIKEKLINIALGIGGGTCIDIAKLSSSREGVPFMSIPTAASHDGMCSPVASIHVDKHKKSFPTSPPLALIADTKIIKTAPRRMFNAGCADILSNYTAVADWKLARDEKGEPYASYAAALSILSSRHVLDAYKMVSEFSLESVKHVIEGLIGSGAAMCITSSSRPCSGAEHLFSHALDRTAEKPAMHGEQCGLGTIMMAKLHGLDWERFRDALETVGAPVTGKAIGLSDKEIVDALVMAPTLRDRYTILHKAPLSAESARTLAEETGVI